MPITKSAKKALRQNVRRRERNLGRKNAFRTAVKKAKRAPQNEQVEAISIAYRAIDKAAKRGVIAKNAAARKKSRLVKALAKTNK